MRAPWSRFDDLRAGEALIFDRPPVDVLVACDHGEVMGVLTRVDAATAAGKWAYGFVSYEAAAGLDVHLPMREPAQPDGAPLAWFAITDAPQPGSAVAARGGVREYWAAPWQIDTPAPTHADAVRQIHADIAAGDYYQANLTVRLDGRVVGDTQAFYADLAHAQQGAFNAYLDLGDHVIASASPELFFEWSAQRLRCRPMKGTAPRANDPRADRANRDRLRRSAKDAAENVMIVDLLRNDLGRVAVTGSVQVRSLLGVERFGSVWQLTSEIVAVPRGDVRLPDLFGALFPCGSVTGAPKGSAMKAIVRLEPRARGVYCGAIGWVAPPTNDVRARFSVAIRTVTIEDDGAAIYGSGGGITIGSDAAAEYQELIDKTALLARAADDTPLVLLETLGHDPVSGFRNLDLHLARMAASATFFGVPFDETAIREQLRREVVGATVPQRVAVRLADDGAVTVNVTLLIESNQPVLLAVDDRVVDQGSIWLRHKTNHRSVYERARARHPRVDDVLLVNTRGEVTESTIANVAVRVGEHWYTPPLECGLLPGVGRGVFLTNGQVRERVLTVDAVRRADAVALISSLRGWRAARVE